MNAVDMPSPTAPLMPTYGRADIVFERGEGAYLYASDGRRYLDFTAGIAVTSLGHAHPRLIKALNEQAAKLWHTSNLFRIPEQERLAARLVEASFADCVFFANSGAEAAECTIKLIRRYHYVNGRPERWRIITFEGAFHGRTLATLAAGGQKKHLEGFGPKVDGFDQVPFDDRAALDAAIGPETAGIMIEPIQAEGGVRSVSPAFLRHLREVADRHGLLLAIDEIQTGMGRTGKLFAHEWAGVTPDVMALAKALGGGIPIGACLATRAAAAGMTAGTHGSTFGGNPLAMAVGNAVLDVMLEPEFLARVRQTANHLRQQMAMVVERERDIFTELRGEGMLLGLKCKPLNSDVAAALRARGLLGVGAGDNVLRFLPPLIIGTAHIAEAIAMIEAACQDMRKAGLT